jgi:hypothetical protein
MSVLILPTCPNGCTENPATERNLCAPEVHYGEIVKLYIASAEASDFSNVEDLAEWTPRLVNVGIGPDDIRTLSVRADMPSPETSPITISEDRTVTGFRAFSIPFDVDETGDINYEWMLSMQCGFKNKVWFETADGMLYGGNDGITGSFTVDHNIPRERTAQATISGTFNWKALRAPLRCLSPLA